MNTRARDRRCPICAAVTQQHLRQTATGAAWFCVPGEHIVQEYTHDDMRHLLVSIAARLPAPPEKPQISIEGYRVFFESNTSGEAELDAQFVRIHVDLVGALPKVGEPLYTRVSGLPAPFNVVPYGKVTRIECPHRSNT